VVEQNAKMNRMKDEIGKLAVETTTAFSPVVGAQFNELVKSAAHVAGSTAKHPAVLGRHLFGLLKSAAQIVSGRSELAPHPKDRRFTDQTWARNPLYRGTLQFWMAFRTGLLDCIDDIDLDKNERARARLLAGIIMDSLAPTNTLLGNPAVVKRFYETGGRSLFKGMGNAWDDFIAGRKLPSQVDSRGFEVGTNLANTEGAVIFRNDMMEIIQYSPLTEKVREIPLLVVPPQINKFYVLDLTSEKSLVRYLVSQGFRVFIISWFNPGPAQQDWGLDNYVDCIIEATDIVLEVSRRKKLNIMGACSGGIMSSIAMSHLAAIGDQRINSGTLQVCVLDPQSDDSEIGTLLTEASVEFARDKSARKGVLSGTDLATTFAWMRPNDLIWNYFVNNYMMGDSPPAFDVLHWNSDATNLPARLHSDYLDFWVDAPFDNPGTIEFKGEKLDLSRVRHDMFMSSGLTDHITPWRACFRATGLFGGDVEFVVSSSGHIQSLVNPPGNPKSRFMSSPAGTMDTTEWLEHAQESNGSWWEHWNEWLGERSGNLRSAPRKLGNVNHPPLDKAPGLYIFG